jgi:hypothetical protein
MFAGGRLLSVYRGGIPKILIAKLEDEVLWSPVEPPPEKSAGSLELVARCQGGGWGESVAVELEADPELSVCKLHVGRQLLRTTTIAGRTVRFEPITLTPELESEKHAVLETLRDGQLRRMLVCFEMGPTHGAAIESSGAWRVLSATTSLDRADLSGRKVYIRPPSASGRPGDDWALLEGTNFCGRPRAPIKDFHALLHGFGQALELGFGPYNEDGANLIRVAEAVTNYGSLATASCTGDTWGIDFRHRVEPASARILALVESRLEDVAPGAIEWKSGRCTFSTSSLNGKAIAFGLAFDGACVGTAIPENAPYPQLCSLIEGCSDWQPLAACLRWLRLPLLNQCIRRSLATRIDGCEYGTFCSWTSGEAPVAGLQQSDPNTDRWQYLLRRLFERWRPKTMQAGGLIRQFELLSGNPTADLNTCWERHDELLNIHPVLLATVANLGVPVLYPDANPYERRVLLDMLVNLCLDLPRNAGDSDRKSAEQKCLADAASSMAVDPAFVEKALLSDAQKLYEGASPNTRNLRIALAVRPLRQWLAARLI